MGNAFSNKLKISVSYEQYHKAHEIQQKSRIKKSIIIHIVYFF